MARPPHVRQMQRGLLPVLLSTDPPPSDLRQSAVLVLLFPSRQDVSFLLTERPHSLSSHAGQMSLPGGAREPEDENLCATALRETSEELGIDTTDLEVLGRLEDVDVRVSGYTITPFVAWSDHPPHVRPQPNEVASVLPVPLHALLAGEAVRHETWDMRGSLWEVSLYRFSGFAVWGATARILAHLAARFESDVPAPHPLPGHVRPLGHDRV